MHICKQALHLEIGCIILTAEKILKTWALPYMWCDGELLQTLGIELKESFNRCILVGRRGVSQQYKTIAPYFKGWLFRVSVSRAHWDLERQFFFYLFRWLFFSSIALSSSLNIVLLKLTLQSSGSARFICLAPALCVNSVVIGLPGPPWNDIIYPLCKSWSGIGPSRIYTWGTGGYKQITVHFGCCKIMQATLSKVSFVSVSVFVTAFIL